MATNLLDLDHEGLVAFCEPLGEKRFRATQLFRWIHQKGASSFDQMSDLAKSLREKLATALTGQFDIQLERSLRSIREAMRPYTRFVETQQVALAETEKALRGAKDELQGLAARVNSL